MGYEPTRATSPLGRFEPTGSVDGAGFAAEEESLGVWVT
jgi:hypothetical protein